MDIVHITGLVLTGITVLLVGIVPIYAVMLSSTPDTGSSENKEQSAL